MEFYIVARSTRVLIIDETTAPQGQTLPNGYRRSRAFQDKGQTNDWFDWKL